MKKSLLAGLFLIFATCYAQALTPPTAAIFTNVSNNSYTRCNVDGSGIGVTSCNTTTLNNGLLNGPTGVAIYDAFIYFINTKESSYTQCPINQIGEINSYTCKKGMLTPGTMPRGMMVSGHFAYFANANSSYTQCALTADGIDLASCKNISLSDSLVVPVAIATDNNFAYFVNAGNNSYTQCLLSSWGIQSNLCQMIIPKGEGSLDEPQGIAIDNGFAYFVNVGKNGESSYTQCAVTNTGIDSNTCKTVKPAALGKLADAISIQNNIVYFANSGDNSYTQCSINNNGIDPTSCKISKPTGDGSLAEPAGAVVASNFLSQQLVYLTNGTDGYVQCNADYSGIKTGSCKTLPLMGAKVYGVKVHHGFAYFATTFGTLQCREDSDNGIDVSSCNKLGLPAANVLLDKIFAYLNAVENYFQCTVSNNAINSSSCKKFAYPTDGGRAYGIVIDGGSAYFGDFYDQDGYIGYFYKQCLVSADGIDLNACSTGGLSAITNDDDPDQELPEKGLVLANGSAYVLTYSSSYYQCPIDNNGVIEDACQGRKMGSGELDAIAFHDQLAYFTYHNNSGAGYQQCHLEANGDIGSCESPKQIGKGALGWIAFSDDK